MRKYMAFVMLAASFLAWAGDEPAAAARLLRAQDLPIEVDPEALQRQYSALQAMRLDSVEYSRLGSVKRISGDIGVVLSSHATDLKPGDSGDAILELFKDVLLADGTETLKVTRNDAMSYGNNTSIRTLRFSQEIRGIPVLNSFVGISIDDTTKRVFKFGALFVPDHGLDRTPKLSATQAEQIVPGVLSAMRETGTAEVEIIEGTHLAYYFNVAEVTPPKLVWVVRMRLEGVPWAYYVDAMTGVIVDRVPESHGLTRRVYNANSSVPPPQIPNGLPAALSQSQINADVWALEAWNAVLTADSKLRQRFPLPSGNFPTETRQVVRYSHPSPTASHYWIDDKDYISYSPPGVLSGVNVNSATSAPDITYHEYAHGIAKRTFLYGTDTFNYESGALHEGFADIAASAVDIANSGISPASWRIGEGWFVSSSAGTRSMADPVLDSYPYASNDWYPLRAWSISGQHFNSTIFSHAYYLSIVGGLNAGWAKSYIPEITVPALDPIAATAEQRAREIFVAAAFDIDVSVNPTFLTMKNTAMFHANLLHGAAAQTSIEKAFEAVGVGYQCTAEPATAPSFVLEDLMCDGRFVLNWPDMPGVNRYVAQIAPQVYGWSFGQIAVDGDLNQCMPHIATPSMLRMRACNNCGCGPWSQTAYMYDWPGQCP